MVYHSLDWGFWHVCWPVLINMFQWLTRRPDGVYLNGILLSVGNMTLASGIEEEGKLARYLQLTFNHKFLRRIAYTPG